MTGMIDRPSVQTTENGGPRGEDGGNRIQGRTRHAGVDPLGLHWVLPVHPAPVQDREGAPPRTAPPDRTINTDYEEL